MSHRYDHIPLLPSDPGGFCRSWSHRTYPSTKVQKIILRPNISINYLKKILQHSLNKLISRQKQSFLFTHSPSFFPSKANHHLSTPPFQQGTGTFSRHPRHPWPHNVSALPSNKGHPNWSPAASWKSLHRK